MGQKEKAKMVKLNKNRTGFSLIELVIVVVILGIIAAIAIPRIGSGSQSAGQSALRANLASLRNAIDWYYSEHKNKYPGELGDGTNAAGSELAFANQLTKYTNADGRFSDEKLATHPFGPYIRGTIPTLSVGTNKGEATVDVQAITTPLAVNVAGGTGWIYSTSTGQIIGNADDTGSDGATFDTY